MGNLSSSSRLPHPQRHAFRRSRSALIASGPPKLLRILRLVLGYLPSCWFLRREQSRTTHHQVLLFLPRFFTKLLCRLSRIVSAAAYYSEALSVWLMTMANALT